MAKKIFFIDFDNSFLLYDSKNVSNEIHEHAIFKFVIKRPFGC